MLPSIDIVRALSVAEGIGTFRRSFGAEVMVSMKTESTKVRRFFERAFVRWVFNAIRNGHDPFRQPLEWHHFVSQKDVSYLLTKEVSLHHIEEKTLDWTWIIDKNVIL